MCIGEDSSNFTFLRVENSVQPGRAQLASAGWRIYGKPGLVTSRQEKRFCLSLLTLLCRAWRGRSGDAQKELQGTRQKTLIIIAGRGAMGTSGRLLVGVCGMIGRLGLQLRLCPMSQALVVIRSREGSPALVLRKVFLKGTLSGRQLAALCLDRFASVSGCKAASSKFDATLWKEQELHLSSSCWQLAAGVLFSPSLQGHGSFAPAMVKRFRNWSDNVKI